MISWWHTILEDARYGIRVLRRQFAPTLIVVLVLGAGIGATTAMFALVHDILLNPLPYPTANRLVYLHWRNQAGNSNGLSATKFLFWQQHSRSFESLSASELVSSGANLAGGDGPVYVHRLRVSKEFLRTLGIQPMLGRGFTPDEDRPGSAGAAILSDDLWRRNFGGSAAVLGKTIRLDSEPLTVVGVLPPNVKYSQAVDVWSPLQLRDDASNEANNLAVIGSLRKGTSLMAAQKDADSRFAAFRRSFPNLVKAGDRGVYLQDYREWLVGDVKTSLLAMLGAALLVLAIVCTNAVAVLASRAGAREQEMAIRSALGVSRSRLLQQTVVENLLLTTLAAAVGLALAWRALPVLVAFSPIDLPRAGEVHIGFASLLVVGGLCLTAALLFGMAGARRAIRIDIRERLSESGQRTGVSRRRIVAGDLLVCAQLALSLILLAGATLLTRTFAHLRAVNLGFDPANVTVIDISLSSPAYQSGARSWEVSRRLVERLQSIPSVVWAATVSTLPLQPGLNIPAQIEGRGPSGYDSAFEYRAVSAGYFRTVQIPLLAGRIFNEADAARSPAVLVINSAMARRYWPNGSPLGQYVTIAKGLGPLADTPREVVGVVGDTRELELGKPAPPVLFVPFSQVPDALIGMLNNAFLRPFLIRTNARGNLQDAFRAAIKEAGPDLPIASYFPLTQVVDSSAAAPRFNAWLASTYGIFAAFLSAVGLYGLLNYQLRQRGRDIAVRVALGAGRGRVFALVVRKVLLLAGIGIGAGMPFAFLLVRALSSMLYGVRLQGLELFAAPAAMLAAVCLLASAAPVWRAARADPSSVLRVE